MERCDSKRKESPHSRFQFQCQSFEQPTLDSSPTVRIPAVIYYRSKFWTIIDLFGRHADVRQLSNPRDLQHSISYIRLVHRQKMEELLANKQVWQNLKTVKLLRYI